MLVQTLKHGSDFLRGENPGPLLRSGFDRLLAVVAGEFDRQNGGDHPRQSSAHGRLRKGESGICWLQRLL